MNNEYDKQLKQIKNLKWLPWIGDNYIKQKKRLLIVGEYHYKKKLKDNKYENIQFTRLMHKETALYRNYYKMKIYKNFHMAMFKNDNFDTSKFWHKTTYYNLIQRVIFKDKEQIQNKDYQEGWQIFIEICKILEPNICIFLGLKSANYFNKFMQNTNFKYQKIKIKNKLTYSSPRIAEFFMNTNKTKLIFIHNPGDKYNKFIYQEWNKFLQREIPEYF